jgi:preprotein translocase subunit SecG
MELITTFLYIVFVLSALVLVVVILLQEGKGGGLTSALGTGGQQTFGVGASGINKFTGWTGAIFLVSALGIHVMNRVEGSSTLFPSESSGSELVPPPGGAPADGSAPANGGSTPPANGGSTPPSNPPPANPPQDTPK